MRIIGQDGPDTTPTLLFNPSKEDFIDQIATASPTIQTLILPSRVITTFPKYIADHIAKHLARQLALEGNPGGFEERYQAQLERIYIKLDQEDNGSD